MNISMDIIFPQTDKKAYDVIHALVGGEQTADWDAMFEAAAKNYNGIFYDTGNLPMVNIFIPLEVTEYVTS